MILQVIRCTPQGERHLLVETSVGLDMAENSENRDLSCA